MAQQPEVLKEDEDNVAEEYIVTEEPIKEEPAEEPDTDEKDDGDDAPAAKAHEDETEEDREAIRERRRKEKLERKERREKAIGRDKTELNFLRQRNDELERRMMAIEGMTKQTALGTLDRQIQEAVSEAEAAERIIAKAVEAGNGEDVAKALKFRDNAIARAQQLYSHKQAAETQTPAAPAIDNAVQHYASEFINNNKWYDPNGGDEDSAIVLAIDNKLSQEGYDPRTEEYWEELNARVKRRLPEKFQDTAKSRREPKGAPPVGSGREHAPSSTRKEIYISPERKAAMVELGVWDDPVLRQRYVKRYAEYDRLNNQK